MSDFMDREDIVIYKLGRIESMLDDALKMQALHIGDDKAVHDSQDARIKSLEMARSRMYGATAVIATVATAAVSWLSGLLHHP